MAGIEENGPGPHVPHSTASWQSPAALLLQTGDLLFLKSEWISAQASAALAGKAVQTKIQHNYRSASISVSLPPDPQEARVRHWN